MGEFTINGINSTDIAQVVEIPKGFTSPKLISSSLILMDSDYGKFLFQELKASEYSIWLSEYRLKENANLYGTVDQQVLELQIVLQNELDYKMQGIGQVKMQQRSCNLYYEPYIENKIFMRKGSALKTFDIHLKQKHLEQLSVYFPVLNSFIDDISKGKFSVLNSTSQFINADILYLIDSICSSPFYGDAHERFNESKIESIILQVLYLLSDISSVSPKFSSKEVEAVRELRHYIIENPFTQLSIQDLAKMFIINSFHLKKVFKEKYGQSIHQFIIAERMQMACNLLTDTNMAIPEIASSIGYRSSSAFIDRFKKIYKTSPLQFRKR